jgi:hypothetical protein
MTCQVFLCYNIVFIWCDQMSNKIKPLNTKQIPSTKAQKTRARTSLWAWLLGIATLIGALAAIMTFLPRPVVSVADPVDPENPYSSAFTITNGNFIPLTDVSLGFFPILVNMGGVKLVGEPNAFLTRPEWMNHYLGIDEKFTITLAECLGPTGYLKSPPQYWRDLREADIKLVVKYKPWFIPIERQKEFRFTAHKQSNGKIYWYSTPLK